MANFNLAELSLIPTVAPILNSLVNEFGVSSAVASFNQLRTIIQTKDFSFTAIDSLLGELDTFLSAMSFIPGGKIGELDTQVKRFKSIVDAIEAGQNPVVASVDYTTRAGVKRELDLSLSDHPVAA